MGQLVIFPDQSCFQRGVRVAEETGMTFRALPVPPFCDGLTASVILVTGRGNTLIEALKKGGVDVSGAVDPTGIDREIPESGPADPVWKDILGSLRLQFVTPSVTDQNRLTAQITVEHSMDELIPIAARLIRGGTFVPAIPALTFEEEHRLISLSPDGIRLSRCDDLPDIWIMMRTTVELLITAARNKHRIRPETSPRQGLGAGEIFRRLPGTDCKECNFDSCMELAMSITTGRTSIKECRPLPGEDYRDRLSSMKWLLHVMGLDHGD